MLTIFGLFIVSRNYVYAVPVLFTLLIKVLQVVCLFRSFFSVSVTTASINNLITGINYFISSKRIKDDCFSTHYWANRYSHFRYSNDKSREAAGIQQQVFF